MKLDGKDKLSTISLLQYLHGIVMFIFIFLNNFISARFMGQHTERQYQLKNQGEQNKSSFKWYLFTGPTSSNLTIFVYLCFRQGKALLSIRYIKLFGKAFLGIYSLYTCYYSMTFCDLKKKTPMWTWFFFMHIMFRNIACSKFIDWVIFPVKFLLSVQ